MTAEPTMWLTVAEVAEQLRVSTMTVYRLCRAGDLPSIRVGSSIRIKREDLAQYLTGETV
jgi:excisionase family DNA binding protein